MAIELAQGNYELRCADLLSELPKLPDGCIDLTVTSPPYNIGKEYERCMPLDEYMRWCQSWMEEVYRVTKSGGSFWLNLGYIQVADRGRAVPLPYLLWNLSPFYLQQEIVWHYGAGVASRNAFSPRNEKWLWFVKDPGNYHFDLDAVRDPNVKYPHQKKNGKLKCNPLGKNPGDVWMLAKVTSGEGRASKERMPHPAQFPLAVIKRIVLACSRPNDLILDPFAGSGSALVASLACGRRALGIEIRQDYCKVAGGRLQTSLAQATELSLF